VDRGWNRIVNQPSYRTGSLNKVLPTQIDEQRSEFPIKIVIGIAGALTDNSSILEAGHRYLESPQCLSCVNLGGRVLGANFEAQLIRCSPGDNRRDFDAAVTPGKRRPASFNTLKKR
jgi:hypothetical protein